MTPSDSPTELTSAAEARVIDPVAMPQYVVRTGAVRSLSVMQASQAYGYGDRVVARTDRGTQSEARKLSMMAPRMRATA